MARNLHSSHPTGTEMPTVCWRLDTGGNLATDEEVKTTKGCAEAAVVWAKSGVHECFLGADRAV